MKTIVYLVYQSVCPNQISNGSVLGENEFFDDKFDKQGDALDQYALTKPLSNPYILRVLDALSL